MGVNVLLAAAILFPALSAAICYLVRKPAVRNIVVGVTAVVLFMVAGNFIALLKANGGSIAVSFENAFIDFGWVIKFLDLALLIYVMVIGYRLKKPLVIVLTVLQLIPLVLFESGLFIEVHEPQTAFVIDYLSLIMVLLVSVIGPVITIFASGYMKEHEHHLGLKISRQPRFFMILFMFLGAMNALVMTNDLMWMYFFWEVTTLCSFLLISHDGNTESFKNALRALWINLVGGVAFILGIIIVYSVKGTLSIAEISAASTSGEMAGLLPVGIGLLCLAGFTKSAQFPFQSWLLGAMVAPTPVSALLHSSTMVKAGVYLIVRLAPAYGGTLLGRMVAVAGGFTFVAASAIAISQRNGKRVLAYSTIANLGLVVCCAGIGGNVAIGAAIMLMIFHALSKGLLFLCIGTIEQGIGSRDIEDMQGLMKRMPFTTIITVIGMISMLLPPFGVLLTKWLAIEAAVHIPVVLVTIVLGSAFTVVFWAKWIGIILTMSYKTKYNAEKLSAPVRGSLVFLIVLVIAASLFVAPLYNNFVQPQIMMDSIVSSSALGGANGGIWVSGQNNALEGGFESMPLFIIIAFLMFMIPYFLLKTKPERIKTPYLCGENTDDIRGIEFTSPGDKLDNVVVHNYYLSGVFGEKNLTKWSNLIAAAILLIMFGVVI